MQGDGVTHPGHQYLPFDATSACREPGEICHDRLAPLMANFSGLFGVCHRPAPERQTPSRCSVAEFRAGRASRRTCNAAACPHIGMSGDWEKVSSSLLRPKSAFYYAIRSALRMVRLPRGLFRTQFLHRLGMRTAPLRRIHRLSYCRAYRSEHARQGSDSCVCELGLHRPAAPCG